MKGPSSEVNRLRRTLSCDGEQDGKMGWCPIIGGDGNYSTKHKTTIRMCQDIDKHNATSPLVVMQTTKTDTDKCKAWSVCRNSSYCSPILVWEELRLRSTGRFRISLPYPMGVRQGWKERTLLAIGAGRRALVPPFGGYYSLLILNSNRDCRCSTYGI